MPGMNTRLFLPPTRPSAAPQSHPGAWPALCRSVLLLLIAGVAGTASAEVKPNSLFSAGAVLQQGIPVPVWGTGRFQLDMDHPFRVPLAYS